MKNNSLASLALISTLITSQPTLAGAQTLVNDTAQKTTSALSTKPDSTKIEELKKEIFRLSESIKHSQNELKKLKTAKAKNTVLELKEQEVSFLESWRRRCEEELLSITTKNSVKEKKPSLLAQ